MTITTAQRSFIESLLSERLVTLGMSSMDEAVAKLNLPALDKQDASTIIGRLKAMPKDPDPNLPTVVANSARYGKGNRPGRCEGCGHTVEADSGYYYLLPTGKWAVHHKVNECDTAPAPTPVVVTEGVYVVDGKFILVYRTGNNRLAGKVWDGRKFTYQMGSVALAAMGRTPTAEEAAAFGKAASRCCACGRGLKVGASVSVGYGPDCAEKYGWPWG